MPEPDYQKHFYNSEGSEPTPLERALYNRYLYDVLYPTDYRTILVTLTRLDCRGQVFVARAVTWHNAFPKFAESHK